MVQTLTIPDFCVPTLNKTMRGTIRERIQLGKDAMAFFAAYAAKQGISRATGARRVAFTVVFPPGRKRPDPDAILKVGLDACKSAGLIVDDTYEMCLCEPPVYLIGDRLETRISLEDIPVRIVERIG